jgi:hypothetical protein
MRLSLHFIWALLFGLFLILQPPLHERHIRSSLFIVRYGVQATHVTDHAPVWNNTFSTVSQYYMHHFVDLAMHPSNITCMSVYEASTFMYAITVGNMLADVYVAGIYGGKSAAYICSDGNKGVEKDHWTATQQASERCDQTIFRDFNSFSVKVHAVFLLLVWFLVLWYYLHYLFSVKPFADVYEKSLIIQQHNHQMIQDHTGNCINLTTFTSSNCESGPTPSSSLKKWMTQ